MEGLAVMEILTTVLFCGLDILFGWLLFTVFFSRNRSKEDTIWFLLLAWFGISVYTLMAKDMLSPLLVRLFTYVLMLSFIFRENGTKGLTVLLSGFLAALLPELLVKYLTEQRTALNFAAMGAVKLLALLGAWLTGKYLADRVRQQELRELESRMQRQRLEMQTESISALEQNYRQQRKITHEFEHHIQVLDDLLEAGATEEARQFIRRLRGSRSYRSIGVNSRHTIIDVILNQKYQTAQENDIRMQIQVNDLSGVKLPTDTLVVILSNLLDNAIEACRKLDGYREVDCSVLHEDGLYVAIRNTSQPVEIRENNIATSKADSLNHGYGLNNVCILLEHLEAEYTFDYSDGWFRFVAEIPEE